MPTTTDSHIVERHEDGTWTETIVVNGRPQTKKEEAIELSILGGLFLLTMAPVFYIIGADWREQRRARKAEAAKLKSV